MDGFETLRRLKDNPDTRMIPVIIISCLNSEADEERGLCLGAVDYIFKPLKSAIVRARVRTHLQIVSQIRTIERMGLMDALTDIPNRRCFDGRLLIEWRRAQRDQKSISFLMMDLDKFKDYNDTWGHLQGDALLKAVTAAFTAAARRSGDLAARIGGEEFGLLLPDTTIESATMLAEEIRSKVEDLRVPTADGKTQTRITISIGVTSTIPGKDMSFESFLLAGDNNLYKAKNAGRNRVWAE
jgi:diguanylate cyclase (GGDEF)-like protein